MGLCVWGGGRSDSNARVWTQGHFAACTFLNSGASCRCTASCLVHITPANRRWSVRWGMRRLRPGAGGSQMRTWPPCWRRSWSGACQGLPVAALPMQGSGMGPVPSEIFVLKRLRHKHVLRFIEFFEDAKYLRAHARSPPGPLIGALTVCSCTTGLVQVLLPGHGAPRRQ